MQPTPLETIHRLVAAMNAGDLEAALSLYTPEATLVARPNVVASGGEAMRQAVAAFIALRPTLVNEAERLIEAGSVALYCGRWSLSGTDPEGNPVRMAGLSSDVLQRQANGSWQIALDNPWGTAILE